jgi:hypothetical protein
MEVGMGWRSAVGFWPVVPGSSVPLARSCPSARKSVVWWWEWPAAAWWCGGGGGGAVAMRRRCGSHAGCSGGPAAPVAVASHGRLVNEQTTCLSGPLGDLQGVGDDSIGCGPCGLAPQWVVAHVSDQSSATTTTS